MFTKICVVINLCVWSHSNEIKANAIKGSQIEIWPPVFIMPHREFQSSPLKLSASID